jgi:DNA-binding NtrC family response regulator
MKKSILLVDDDARILETAQDILEASGYPVQTSETGEGALRKLRAEPFHLMIVDFNLLDTTGTELAIQAKKIRPELVIFLMTGEASVDLGAAASAVRTVLTKPVNPGELLKLIEKMV